MSDLRAQMDHLEIETLQRCEQEYLDRHVRGITGPSVSHAILFGLAVHDAVHTFYATEDANAAAAAAAARWAKDEANLPTLTKPDYRTSALAQAWARVYAHEYRREGRPYEVVWNEGYIATDHEDGIPDRVVRRKTDGLLYVLGLKSSALSANAAYWRSWHHSQEAAIHIDLVEAALGERLEGFWCDFGFVSSRKDGPKPEDFCQYGPVTYAPTLREHLRRQRVRWREHRDALRTSWEREGIAYEPLRSTRACTRYNSACPLLDACSQDSTTDRENYLQTGLATGRFVVRYWDPKTRDET